MKMVRVAAVTVLGALSLALMGCAYGGVAASGENAVVSRNDMFLFGLLRKAYVCKITDGGLSSCREGEAP